jgi:hypothetical protein
MEVLVQKKQKPALGWLHFIEKMKGGNWIVHPAFFPSGR